MEEKKICFFEECSPSSIIKTNKKIIIEKEKAIRKITTTEKWELEESDYIFDNQLDCIKKIQENLESPKITLFIREIKNKIHSYGSQDVKKNIYSEEKIVDFDHVIKILLESNLDCFYCKKKVNIIYKNVREPSQWSLERIDNKYGHNVDNVVIACLSCNLRRRTMYHERFVFTKQMSKITKLGGSPNYNL
jgi:hypothetical protein